MSKFAERRIIMDNNFIFPISIEKFAAYLDGNLPENEMNHIENIISENPQMGELVNISDSIDQSIQDYIQDDFLYDADMFMLDETNIEIPILDDILGESYLGIACNTAAEVEFDNIIEDDSTFNTSEFDITTDFEAEINDFMEFDSQTNNNLNPDQSEHILGDDDAFSTSDMNIFSPEG